MPMLTREAFVKKLSAGEAVAGDRVRVQREAQYGFVTKEQLGAAATDVDVKKMRDDAEARAKERFGDELVGRVVPYVFATKGRKADGLDLACKGCQTAEWDRAP